MWLLLSVIWALTRDCLSSDYVGRRRSACESRENQHLFTGEKDATFPYFSKGKPVSAWLTSIFPDIYLYKSLFCDSNSRPAFCFALSPCSPLITQRLRHPVELMTVRWSKRDVFITFEIRIFFLQKCMNAQQEAFIHPPESCKACFFMNLRILFYELWTV